MKHLIDKKESYYAGAVFLVWPFLALVSAFLNFRKPWAKNVLWAFTAFVGFTFALTEGSTSDIARYVAGYQNLHQVSMSIPEAVERFIEGGQIDILNTIITYTLSRITDQQEALTFVYAAIFGFFFSRNVWYVMERLKGRISILTAILVIAFLFIIPIWFINGFRMWTAAHVFLYGLLPYLCERNKNKLWISFVAFLVHFSFVIPTALLIGYLFLGNRVVLYFGFFITTFFISSIELAVVNDIVQNFTPERFQERSEPYLRGADDDGLDTIMPEEEGRSLNWYIVWYRKALNFYLTGALVFMFINRKKFILNDIGMANLFSFTLLFFGFANFISHLPSLGRFLLIAHLLAMAVVIFYVQNKAEDKTVKQYAYLALPVLFLFIIVSIRRSLFFMSATSILGNPVLGFFTAGENMPLEQFLRMLI